MVAVWARVDEVVYQLDDMFMAGMSRIVLQDGAKYFAFIGLQWAGRRV
jgi:hypothetical protein